MSPGSIMASLRVKAVSRLSAATLWSLLPCVLLFVGSTAQPVLGDVYIYVRSVTQMYPVHDGSALHAFIRVPTAIHAFCSGDYVLGLSTYVSITCCRQAITPLIHFQTCQLTLVLRCLKEASMATSW